MITDLIVTICTVSEISLRIICEHRLPNNARRSLRPIIIRVSLNLARAFRDDAAARHNTYNASTLLLYRGYSVMSRTDLARIMRSTFILHMPFSNGLSLKFVVSRLVVNSDVSLRVAWMRANERTSERANGDFNPLHSSVSALRSSRYAVESEKWLYLSACRYDSTFVCRPCLRSNARGCQLW